jgi:hypothetical protein
MGKEDPGIFNGFRVFMRQLQCLKKFLHIAVHPLYNIAVRGFRKDIRTGKERMQRNAAGACPCESRGTFYEAVKGIQSFF